MAGWDWFTGILLLYTATWTPFEMAFLATDDSSMDRFVANQMYLEPMFLLNRAVDAAFIVDIILVFFLPYTSPDGALVDNHLAVVRQYLKGQGGWSERALHCR
jgi:hypothetical protein